MEPTNFHPGEDWRSLTIYQVMVGSFLHGKGGSEGYHALWGPDDDRERRLLNYVRDAMTFRRDNPAMWRGRQEFDRYKLGDAEILVVIKHDEETGNRVAMIFSDRDASVTIPGADTPTEVKGYVPALIKLA